MPAQAGPSSVALDVLNHSRHHAIGASSSFHTHAHAHALAQAPSLSILGESLAQSSVPFQRELVARALERGEPVLLVTLLRHPSIYLDALPPDLEKRAHGGLVHTLDICSSDAYSNSAPQAPSFDTKSIQDAIARVYTQARGRLSVIIDSVEPLLTETDNASDVVVDVVRSALASLRDGSRLLVGVPLDSLSEEAESLLQQFENPLLWDRGSSTPSGTVAPGTFTRLSIQPAALAAFIRKEYGLVMPPTPPALRRHLRNIEHQRSDDESQRASHDAGGHADDEDQQSADPRLWGILEAVISRGPLGSGTSNVGWWNAHQRDDRPPLEALSSSDYLSHQASSFPGTQRANAARRASEHQQAAYQACIYARQRQRSGKFAQEVLHYRIHDGRLHLLPILPHTAGDASAVPAASGAKYGEGEHQKGKAQSAGPRLSDQFSSDTTHAGMLFKLPFNLNETGDQRARREGVALPHAQLAQAPGRVIFQPESDDDPDEDDPDDDVEL
ncbi:hypothetical protein K437DRAFT_42555 [Tilletiaria anomala UBC 951]|uniref:Elongator complex protein 5 n=1 Tax=Tilletiaria anomala (strain ATCC 24038 / CBS 436.72 / UBC 951) TaxID=1037660 RepID=A0A066VAD3_TILAU|nr:uncharacterized protein K437DRAFT_42555 [Tilletiaria anomala UBC 951]KDN37248.1 hypothetical protein K437DRAFT_42555 [Tilletiaria anomala UBC 951]